MPRRTRSGRFLTASASNPRAYRSSPLRDVVTVSPNSVANLAELDEEQRLEVERVRDATNIRDEPEAIGPAIVNGYAEAAQFHRTLQHLAAVEQARERRPELSPDARVRDLRRRAKDSHVDLSHELHIISRDLEKARMAGRDAPARALNRIEGLEALLDGVELAA